MQRMERALTAICEALAGVPQGDLATLVVSCRALLQVDRDMPVALALVAPCEQLLDVLLKILHVQVADQLKLPGCDSRPRCAPS